MKHIFLAFISFCVLWASMKFFKMLKEDNVIAHLRGEKTHFGGLVLARAGSKGVPNKNLVKIMNVTLLTRALQTMVEFGKFDSIWVSTDSEYIANEAFQTKGVQVHRRAHYTASDNAASVDAVQEFLTYHEEIDVVALVQCTSPFLRVKYLENAYNLIKKGFHSVFSLTRQYKLRWKRNAEGSLVPENFRPENRPRRQSWKGELVENGMFYFTFSDIVIKKGLLQGGRMSYVEVPQNESLEIDSTTDLYYTELLMELNYMNAL